MIVTGVSETEGPNNRSNTTRQLKGYVMRKQLQLHAAVGIENQVRNKRTEIVFVPHPHFSVSRNLALAEVFLNQTQREETLAEREK